MEQRHLKMTESFGVIVVMFFDFGNFNHQIQNEPADSDSLRLYAAFILRQVARLYLGAGYRWDC